MGSDNYDEKKSKILIMAATGYLGNYMVRASIALGYPTFVYVRPINPNSVSVHNTAKIQLLEEFGSMGVTIFQGELDEHEKLVWVLQQVDVVISTLAVPQHLDQLKLIHAMKEAGNIKRFVPSEFGNEVDRAKGLPPFQRLLENKKKIRRATEAAGIPFTYVAANTFAVYFVDLLIHPHENNDHQLTIYGDGQTKVVLNYEEDVAIYTIKAATDRRVANRVIICRPPKNIVTQLELVSSWEKKTGRTFKRTYILEEELIKLSQTLPVPDNIGVSILHNVFIKGDQTNFELTENDLEASKLYPEHKYTSVDDLLNLCLVNPPKPKLASFV